MTNRSKLLGINPSVKKDGIVFDKNIGTTNLVTQEVLMRWALNGKARYAPAPGNGKNKRKDWIADWGSWEVFVRTKDNCLREWVPLGKGGIDMGHKVSAVNYAVFGCDLDENPELVEKLEALKVRDKSAHKKKERKYHARYDQYQTPAFAQIENLDYTPVSSFMFDSQNYRFESSQLNRKNGRAMTIRYKDILDQTGVELPGGDLQLADYADLVKNHCPDSKAELKRILSDRHKKLQEQIRKECKKFVRHF